MIPKASQRAGGQDLATHLQNALDNEYVEVAEVRGAVATDLHGAFAEWEAVATGLTRCREYLYSLSVNPQPGQQLSREQYLDYAARVEKQLGLEGQPRAMVFHIKEGREHCHIVWSRIDVKAEKAVHLAFDHEKLMMVSRQIARDHGLQLPDGYNRDQADGRSDKQSLYETQQERMTGLSKEDRMVMITQAFRQSDSARSFVRALEGMGYVLATGKRPYVLVDIYGTMNALPMIDDRAVRTKDLRAFLQQDYPPGSLPTVEEARTLVAELRKAREHFAKAQANDKRVVQLKEMQDKRRAALTATHDAQQERHRQERTRMDREQLAERRALKADYLTQARAVRAARAAVRPTGLAAFLGRVTGISFVIGKLHRHRDVKTFKAFAAKRQEMISRQKQATQRLQRRQEVAALDTARQLKGLAKVEARERQALEVKRVREQRVLSRRGHDHMPALKLDLKPRGRRASVFRAQNRYRGRSAEAEGVTTKRPEEIRQAGDRINLRRSMQEALSRQAPWPTPVDLAGDFARASGGEGNVGDGTSGSEAPKVRVSRAERKSERGRKREDDLERER